MTTLSVILPVRRRPEAVKESIRSWNMPGVELLMGSDAQDTEEYQAAGIDFPHYVFMGPRFESPISEIPADFSKYLTAVNKQNWLAERASGEWLMMASTDLIPEPGWHDVLLAFLDRFDPEFQTIFAMEDYQRSLISHPIMSRAYYQAQGYFVNPEYIHICSDSEQFLAARAIGRMLILPREISEMFAHRNPYFDSCVAWDDVYEAGNNTAIYRQGADVFAKNRKRYERA